MAVHLPAEAADRLVKLLGMLGSAHEGEALNAARMADRLVRDQLKLTWGEVIQPQGRGASGPDSQRVWREPVTWQDAAQLAAQWPECLIEWEQGFLISLLRFPRLSDKQLAILDRLVRKARGTAGVREPADPAAWHPPPDQPPPPSDQPADPPEAEPADQPTSTKKRPRRRRKRQS